MPAADGCTPDKVNVVPVAPAIGAPLRRHWYVNGGVPVAATVNVAVPP